MPPETCIIRCRSSWSRRSSTSPPSRSPRRICCTALAGLDRSNETAPSIITTKRAKEQPFFRYCAASGPQHYNRFRDTMPIYPLSFLSLVHLPRQLYYNGQKPTIFHHYTSCLVNHYWTTLCLYSRCLLFRVLPDEYAALCLYKKWFKKTVQKNGSEKWFKKWSKNGSKKWFKTMVQKNGFKKMAQKNGFKNGSKNGFTVNHNNIFNRVQKK